MLTIPAQARLRDVKRAASEPAPGGRLTSDLRAEAAGPIVAEGFCPTCRIRLQPEADLGWCPCCGHGWAALWLDGPVVMEAVGR